MSSELIRASRLNHSLRTALMIGVMAGISGVAACSQVPDAVNPAEWYRKTVDVFSGEEKKAPKRESKKESDLKADRGKAPPGADKPFPNLAQVDEQAQARRDDLSGGLSADPDRPKYAPAIERQGVATNVLQPKPPAPPPVAAAVPPAAQPAPSMAAQPPAAAPPITAQPLTPKAPAPVARAARPMPSPTPAQPAQAMAPAPSATAPATMSDEQKERQARLVQQLAEIRARAAETGLLPANAMVPATVGEFATVVVSSQGIETGGFQLASTDQLTAAPTRSVLRDAGGAPLTGGAPVKVATILFDNGSFSLKANDRQILGAVSRLYKEQGGTVHIVGHASSRTRNLSAINHSMANFKISVDRADAVAMELMRLGVKRDNIQVAALSDSEPVYFEIMPSGEAGNRRTEIYLVR